jgi:hypothetical protein
MPKTKTLLERVSNPDDWEELIQLLEDANVSQAEAFELVLGTYLELHAAAKVDGLVDDATFVTH